MTEPIPDMQDDATSLKEIITSQVPLLELVEKIAKALVAFVGVAYGIGLLVTNQYLSIIGVSDFSSLHPKYVITGSWIILLVQSAMWPVILPTLSYRFLSIQFTPIIKFLILFLLAMFSVGVSLSFQTVILVYLSAEKLPKYFSLFINSRETLEFTVIMSIMAAVFLLSSKISYFISKIVVYVEQRSVHLLIIANSSLAIIVLIVFHSVSIYMKVPEALGGGRPSGAQLIFNGGGLAFWKLTGASVSTDADSKTSGLVYILYQNDHELVIRATRKVDQVDTQKIIILSKSLVDGILPEE